MTADRIVSEQLMVWRTAKPTQWFSRRLDDSGELCACEFSAYLTGPRQLWQESTRPNALFLSTAAQLNSKLLGPVARWRVQGLVYLPAGAFIDHAFTTALLESTEGRAAVRDFLATADISIAEVSAVSRKGLRGQVVFQPGGVAQARQEQGESSSRSSRTAPSRAARSSSCTKSPKAHSACSPRANARWA